MTEAEAAAKADLFKAMVYARTGLKRNQLICPREKSFMTPCLARDGQLVVVFDSAQQPICVGCEANLEQLLKDEHEKALQ